MYKPIYIHCHESSGYVPLNGSNLFGGSALPATHTVPMQPNWRYGRYASYVSSWDGSTVEEPKEKPMKFICQINLEELPFNNILPREGLLLFYANIEYYNGFNSEGDPVIGMHPCEPEHVGVIYLPPNCMQSDREVYAPNSTQLTFDRVKPAVEDEDMQMFGRSDHLEWEDWPEECEGWELLLQIDSIETKHLRYNFVDCGVLCFLIERNALRNLDFSNVRAIILST